MQIVNKTMVAEDPTTPTRPDTRGLHTWWLLTADTVGSLDLVFNISDVSPRSTHQLHRHVYAPQAVFVVSGRGLQLSEREDPVEVSAGDAIWIPAGEWHGFSNPFDEPVQIASLYTGVGRAADAGYELLDAPDFEFPDIS